MSVQNAEDRLARVEAHIEKIDTAIRAIDHVLDAATKTQQAGHRVRKGFRLSNLLLLAGAGAAVALVVYGRNMMSEQTGTAMRTGDSSQPMAA